MAIASSSAYSLSPSPFPSNRHFTPSATASPHHLSYRPSPLLVLSTRCQSKATVVNGQSWKRRIIESKTPVLVEFYASWCGPCQMLHRVIDEIAGEYGERLNCFVVNADQEPGITEEYDIKAVPVVVFFKNGEQCESVVGTMPKEFYVAAIQRLLPF